MRKLNSFTFITLNGFYKGLDEDISWHKHGEEESHYSEEKLKSDNILLFGRKTYELMQGFWTTAMAAELFPKVAKMMNAAEKIAISNSLKTLSWNNATLLSGNIVENIKQLKTTKGKNISILGSGSIVKLFTEAGLIDQYEIMIDPKVIGKGVPIFDGLSETLNLKLADCRIFKKSGSVLLTYTL